MVFHLMHVNYSFALHATDVYPSRMKKNRVVILASHLEANSPIYANWTRHLSLPWQVEKGYDLSWEPPEDTALIVTPQHYEEPDVTILRKAVESGIPTLVIADGILEYRNTWMNPDAIPGVIFQPVLSHKIATIGASQARIIEAWGNEGKCEIVGAPRFDDLQENAPSEEKNADAPFCFLVTTARTPGFTPEQIETVAQSLLDLKSWFDAADGQINGQPFRVIWRLTGGMAERLQVESEINETLGIEFHKLLHDADALITTPSSTLLEGMLCNIPVATLDYTNSPAYVPAAWSITAKTHLDMIMPDLCCPSKSRMDWQKLLLSEALECQTPAAPRMVELVEKMVQTAQNCQNEKVPLHFPDALLTKPTFQGSAPLPEKLTQHDADRIEVEHLRRHSAGLEKKIQTIETRLEQDRHLPLRTRLLKAFRP